MSAKDVARHTGSTVRTIENWAAASKIQQNDKGKYGLVSALKYQSEKLQVDLARVKLQLQSKEEELDRTDEEIEIEARLAKLRKVIAEANKEQELARIKKFEADKLNSVLVDAEEVAGTWKNAIAKTKAKFISLPAKLALELSGLDKPSDIQARLTVVIDEALNELGDDV